MRTIFILLTFLSINLSGLEFNNTPIIDRIPLAFTRNIGQIKNASTYGFQAQQTQVDFYRQGIDFTFIRPGKSDYNSHTQTLTKSAIQSTENVLRLTIRLHIVNSEANPAIHGEKRLPWNSHYFIGKDPQNWFTDVPNFANLRIENIYPGIDLLYHGDRRQLKYDFIVNPGSDPDQICIQYQGYESLLISKEGELHLHSKIGTLVERKPVAWQIVHGEKVNVPVRFKITDQEQIIFVVGKYHPGYELIIDPEIDYSTFFGGINNTSLADLAVGKDGSIFIAGNNYGLSLPLTEDPFDDGPDLSRDSTGLIQMHYDNIYNGFIARIHPDGNSMMYATYLMGNMNDYVQCLTVDDEMNATIAGFTQSGHFPVTENAYQSDHPDPSGNSVLFVAKLNPMGNHLVFSTLLGGSGQDMVYDLASDADGSLWLCGETFSSDYPETGFQSEPGFIDNEKSNGMISRLSRDGDRLMQSMRIGGQGNDAFHTVYVNQQNVILTGSTSSPDFPVTQNAYQDRLHGETDLIVLKVAKESGELIAGTFIGGRNADQVNDFAILPDGGWILCGTTKSPDFPQVHPLQQVDDQVLENGFILSFDQNAQDIRFSTLFGGSGDDRCSDFLLTDQQLLLLTGTTHSYDFITTHDAFDPLFNPVASALGTNSDAFFTIIDPVDPTLIYSTYLGGSQSEQGIALCLDPEGQVLIGGNTQSNDYPVTSNALDNDYNSIWNQGDVFLTRFIGLEHETESQIRLTCFQAQSIEINTGETIPITWISEGETGEMVQLSLYLDNQQIQVLSAYEPDDGYFLWKTSDKLASNDAYSLQIHAVQNPAISDQSETFRIIQNQNVLIKRITIPRVASRHLPVMDGYLDDPIWEFIGEDTLSRGGQIGDYDQMWQDEEDLKVIYKAAWCDETNRLYIGISIQDDIRSKNRLGYNAGLYERLSFFFDGDNEGGNYWQSYADAQMWRVNGRNIRELAYYPNPIEAPVLYEGDDFISMIRLSQTGNWTCEVVFEIYDHYPDQVKNLEQNQIIGWDIWYDDNDDTTYYQEDPFEIDHQIGWYYHGPDNRNADFLGEMALGNLIGVPYIAFASLTDSGEVVYKSQLLNIAWESDQAGNEVSLALVTGTKSYPIAQATENDGQYYWMVPDTLQEGQTYQLEIVSRQHFSIKTRSASFMLKIAPRITISEPEVSTAWKTGVTETIQWQTVGETGESVQIDLYHQGILIYTIADSLPNNGMFDWRIPYGVHSSNDYRIRITACEDSALSFWSHANFSIEQIPHITLLFPNTSAVTCRAGNTQEISWRSYGPVGERVRIDLYQGDWYHSTIADSISNSMNYLWNIPDDLEESPHYRIKVGSLSDGSIAGISEKEFTILSQFSSTPSSVMPLRNRLHSNYPNPFNPSTVIPFDVASAGHVTLFIYNILGGHVQTLIDRDIHPGSYQFTWDGRDPNGRQASAGMYFVVLKIDYWQQMQKITMIQ